jgi:hypothetical protein
LPHWRGNRFGIPLAASPNDCSISCKGSQSNSLLGDDARVCCVKGEHEALLSKLQQQQQLQQQSDAPVHLKNGSSSVAAVVAWVSTGAIGARAMSRCVACTKSKH